MSSRNLEAKNKPTMSSQTPSPPSSPSPPSPPVSPSPSSPFSPISIHHQYHYYYDGDDNKGKGPRTNATPPHKPSSSSISRMIQSGSNRATETTEI
ncbi:hypothetical protein AKJ16_DCAP04623 [Drosera capensis]